MDLKLNVSKKGLSTTEEVINEEYTLRYGHIFRGPKGDSGEKGEKGDNGVSPKISDNGTWLVFSDELKTYVDTGIKASGSDNNYTDADKALVQTIPEKVSQDEFNETVAGLGEAINDVGTVLSKTKANKEGYYPDMSVGMADNLVGRGDVQDAHINFRPSAGADNITDGAARIERIKGNSVVWNQLFTKINTQTQNGVTCVNNGDGSYTVYTDGGGATAVTSFMMSGASIGLSNHIMLLSGAPNNNDYFLFAAWNGLVVSENKIYKSTTNTEQVYIMVKQGTIINKPVIFYPKLIDLTQMFGAGNEPTTYEEYLQRKPMNIEDEFAYNAGTFVDMHADTLVSTSDNAYDYTKGYARVMGGYKYDITANAGATLEVSFYADGEDDNEEREIAPDSDGKYTFPANGICYVNGDFASQSDVCVCLNHSYDKPHPAYQQEVKDLGWIWEIQDSEGNLLFPNGMRSAGSAYDEIRFNPTKKVWEAVKRVESRVFAEGDAEDTTVKTDGAITNYPLAEPIVVELDYPTAETNMDYIAWDFGTEEAIVPNNVPSAPFRADINYGDNFVDDIRKNKEDIATNKANIAKNTSALNSKQNTLTLTTKPNGNIVIGNLVIDNIAGQSKEFMPATPSGDPMHKAYEAAGAVWNATTSKWKLNGGEFTSDDIRLAYWRGNQRIYPSANLTTLFSFPLKVNFPAQEVLLNTVDKAISLINSCVNNYDLQRVKFTTATFAVYVSNFTFAFYGCQNLISIDNVLNVSNVSNATGLNAYTFYNCKKLEHLLLEGLNTSLPIETSPFLSKESLLYMIDNCASNATFTITLHPDVYAKCTDADNGEWYDDVENAIDTVKTSKGTTITLASA